jgi:hypothetical protein
MPLKLNVGLCKKIGQPDYGSLGASCYIEVELDGGLLASDLETFQRHARNAFVACRQAVNDELARHSDGGSSETAAFDAVAGSQTNSPLAANGHANGSSKTGSRASEKQLQYARQLAGQIRGLGILRLEALSQRMFNRPLVELSTLDASGLIDTLKEIKAGTINIETALNGAAA